MFCFFSCTVDLDDGYAESSNLYERVVILKYDMDFDATLTIF